MRPAAALVLWLMSGAMHPEAQAPAPAGGGLEGTWGGEHIRLIVSSGDLRLQIECLAGHRETQVALAKGGTFKTALPLAPMRGAQLEGGDTDVPLAELSGTITGDTMRLTVGPEGREGAGTYTLTRGGKATLPNCRFRS